MAKKNLSDDYSMSQLIDEQAWRSLSWDFQWSEQLLEKYADKVDWHKVSCNRKIRWTVSMLEKFKDRIDWYEVSRNEDMLWTASMLEKFKDRIDWPVLSRNEGLNLSSELIDKFVERWDWSELILRETSYELFDEAFFKRYKEYIPASEFKDSSLWAVIAIKRKEQLAKQIAAEA